MNHQHWIDNRNGNTGLNISGNLWNLKINGTQEVGGKNWRLNCKNALSFVVEVILSLNFLDFEKYPQNKN